MRGGGTVCEVCGVYLPLDGPLHHLTVERTPGVEAMYSLKLCIRCVDEAEGRIRAAIDQMLERERV